jgi:hypothetical protein
VGPNRPDVIGDITEGGGSKEKWFNTTPIGSSGSAFARPAQGTFGDMERGSLIGRDGRQLAGAQPAVRRPVPVLTT